MDDRTLSLLEFDAVLRGVSNYAVSAAAKAAVLALRPQADEAAVSAALEQTEEAYRIKYKYLLNPTADFDDCAALADKAAAGGLLLIDPRVLTDIIGIALVAVVIGWQVFTKKRGTAVKAAACAK